MTETLATQSAVGRVSRRTALWSAIPAALVGVVIAAWFSGAANPTLVIDPGVVVRWGLPTVSTGVQLGQALALGAFVLLAVAGPRGSRAWLPMLKFGGSEGGRGG